MNTHTVPMAAGLRQLMLIPVVFFYLLMLAIPVISIEHLNRTELLIIVPILLATAAGFHWLVHRMRSARVVVDAEFVSIYGGFGLPDLVQRAAVTGMAVGPQARGTNWVPVILTKDGRHQAVTVFARGNETLAREDAERIAAVLGLPTEDEQLGPIGEPDTAKWYQRALI